MEPRLVQQQTQKLILSPQIRQYLKLLQLPAMELKQAVETALAENPLLDEKTDATALPEDGQAASSKDSEAHDRNNEELRFSDNVDHFEKIDESFKERYEEDNGSFKDPSDIQKSRNYQESLVTKREGLTDFLLWQVRFMDLTETETKIANEIIGNMDEDGYLKASLEEIAAGVNVTVEAVTQVLARMHELDPPGACARNLQEALLLQLKRKGPEAQIASEIVSKHLSLLEKRDWKQLAKILAVDTGTIQEAANLIAHLEPKPGRIFYADESLAVTPDATVSFDEEDTGKLKIELHNEQVPELRINGYYRKLLRDKATDDKTKAFLREKMQNALNFIRALKLRKSTIHEITEQIIEAQPEFFDKGFAQLKPLRLKDVAHRLGIHESTVSRAVQGKYIQTPQGTIPYRSFFSSKLETTTGESESQKSIMEKIKAMVQKEDPKHPLSDQTIVKRLQDEGVVIARRTIAKYRDMLKILPSHLRKRK